MMIPKISVVMGVYNQIDCLPKVLEGYANQSLPLSEFELIFVDSGSTDGTVSFLSSASIGCAIYVEQVENRGKAAARNWGSQLVQAPIMVITDADMIPDPTFLKSHWVAHQTQKRMTCFEGLTNNMTQLHWPPNPDWLEPYIQQSLAPLQRLGWYYWLTGNLSMPVQLFHEMGGFDEGFTGYGWEDLELGYRLQKRGVPLRYLPSAINYHYHVVSRSGQRLRNIEKGKSAALFVSKHPSLAWFLGMNPVSKLVYRLTSPPGRVLDWVDGGRRRTGWIKKCANWFLDEYYYLSGALQDESTQVVLASHQTSID